MVFRTCYCHIEQTTLLLHLAQRSLRTLVREEFLFEAYHKHGTELKTFCRMHRHECYAFAFITIIIVQIRHQRHFRKEIYQLIVGIALFLSNIDKIGNTAHKLLYILLTRLALDTVVIIELGEHTAFTQHNTGNLNGTLLHGTLRETLYHRCKSLQLGKRTLGNIDRLLKRVGNNTPETLGAFYRSIFYFLQRLISYSTCREVDYTLESLFVVLVTYKTEIGNYILYLLALIERQATIYAVWEATFPECLLKDTRLCIGAVQNCKIAIPKSLAVTQGLNLVGHDLSLFKIGIGRIERKRLSVATFREDILFYLFAILCYKAVRRVHNHSCRTVILLQFEYSGTAISFGKTKDIANVGSTKRVDALRIIAHHTNSLARLGQLPHNTSLHIVGILELIDQNIAETLHILFAHLGMVVKKTIGIHQQVIKVHCIGKTAPLAVPFIYLVSRRDTRTYIIATQPLVTFIIRCRDKIALCRRYALGNSIGLVDLLVQLHLLDNALYQTARVTLVVYGKLRGIPQQMSLTTQNFRKHRMESSHPEH